MRSLILALSCFLLPVLAAHGDEKPVLTVHTYSSLTSKWGPGPQIEARFEAQCGCDLQWLAVEDGAALLSRLRLEGKDSRADIVLGLDNNLMAEAEATGLLAPHGLDLPAFAVPGGWRSDHFVPFDWGYFAFVYDRQALATPPRSLAELADGKTEPKIIIEDPRTSTPGLGLVAWIRLAFGDRAPAIWAGLKPKILTVTKGWSEAYGLFTKGEAPLVLSYSTSPAYHAIVEKSDRYAALIFPEGHPLQVEVAARLATSRQSDLAKTFLAFLISPEIQKVLATSNYMYPALDIGDALPPEFARLPKPDKALMQSPEEAAANRAPWIREWLDTVSR